MKKRQASPQSTNWVIVLNNYTDDEVLLLGGLIYEHKPFQNSDSQVRAMAFAEEIAPTTGTPHLQGFMQLSKKGMTAHSLTSRAPDLLFVEVQKTQVRFLLVVIFL